MRHLIFLAVLVSGGCASTGAADPIASTPRFAGPVVPASQALEPVDTVAPSLPDDVRARYRGGTFSATAVVCVDKDGDVKRVSDVKCDPAARDAVESALARWRFKATPVPMCFAANYAFDVGE